ncbi:MAG: hypothetical protein RX318_10250 [bacterium]|nr:hypothetical protein [bacterium]
MTVLHTLAITLGILIVATRLVGVLWPQGYRQYSLRLVESDAALRGAAVLALLVGLIVVVAVIKERSWLEIVLLVFAFIYIPVGMMMLWSVDPYRRWAKKILLTGDLSLRLWCGLGVLVGFLLCFLGFFG